LIIGFSFDKSHETLYIFDISIDSSIVRSGSIVENAFASIVFQLHGGQDMIILCQPEAAISNALFACSCPTTYLKSYFSFSWFSVSSISLNLIFSIIFNDFLSFNISIKSSSVSTEITSISGIIEASFAFIYGINILLNHFSFAQIVAGSTLEIFLNFQSRASSHKKILSFTSLSSLIHQSFKSIQIAIGKSKLGHVFLISAGARFIVILLAGSLELLDFIADLSLSLLS
jgi:hypothetical protein